MTKKMQFAKWHGTGNDFILVDDRSGAFPVAEPELVRRLCDRHFGIGSDGLVLVRSTQEAGLDFHMEFFNPDGSRSFCGNGSRCAFAFWSTLQPGRSQANFSAIDGIHQGAWMGEEVVITLPPSGPLDRGVDGPMVDFVNTGSPHELVWVPDVDAVRIMEEGPRRRAHPRHGSGGCNVNFVQVRNGELAIRTYERGVEAETLSCGSGVVAAALSAVARGLVDTPVVVNAPGGRLRVEADHRGQGEFVSIELIGPVAHVFQGSIDIG
jgi:diaminopimelate epimerase